MASTLVKPDSSMRLNSIVPRMTKAVIDSPSQSTAVQSGPLAWSDVIKDGLIEACGSLKAAAITMDMDPSQLSRDLPSGAFQLKRLEKLNPTERAIVVRRLTAAFLELMDPKAYALQMLTEIESKVREVRQYVSEVA